MKSSSRREVEVRSAHIKKLFSAAVSFATDNYGSDSGSAGTVTMGRTRVQRANEEAHYYRQKQHTNTKKMKTTTHETRIVIRMIFDPCIKNTWKANAKKNSNRVKNGPRGIDPEKMQQKQKQISHQQLIKDASDSDIDIDIDRNRNSDSDSDNSNSKIAKRRWQKRGRWACMRGGLVVRYR